MNRPRGLAAARRHLEAEGFLLESDARWPSVATMVAGEPVKGSWWGHPQGKAIYRALGALLSSEDVIALPLAFGKATLVQRWLWPALLAIAASRATWQTRGLTAPAKRLLAHVRRAGEARSDRLPASLRLEAKGVGDLVRDLERRLLLRAESFHTEKGSHAKRLVTWERWAKGAGVRRGLPIDFAALAFGAALLGQWGREGFGEMRWPWPWPQDDLSKTTPEGRRGSWASSTGR